MKASQFIKKLFEGRTSGNVFLCTYANNRNEAQKFPPLNYVTRNWADVDSFIKDFDIEGRACYFACATMKGQKRTKESVAEINSVYIDLDFKGIVEDEKTILATLKKLKLKPSVVVHSGNGLHCYWLLAKTLTKAHTASCEDMMRRMCSKLAGDTSAAEIARVLRLPGSHNSKNGEWHEVKVDKALSSWKTYSYAEIDEYFESLEPLLTYAKTKRDIEREEKPLNAYQQYAREMRALVSNFDAQELLDNMTFHDVQGHGIDDTYTKIIGAIVADGGTVEECLRVLLKPTERVYNRDRGSEDTPWSERRAMREIKGKFRYFSKKDAEEKQEEAQEIETLNSRAKDKGKKDKIASGKDDAAEGKTSKKKKYDFDSDPPDDDSDGKGKLSRMWSAPHDFWALVPTERLRRGMMPEIIENVAFEYAERFGLDIDALAMSMLTVASSVITTNIEVAAYTQVDNKFKECLRIWQANVGVAGSGKSPIMQAVMGPLMEINDKLRREYNAEREAYDALSKDEQKETDQPKRERTVLPNDSSVESTQITFADNPHGLLGEYDELVSFFGSKSRYGNKSGGGEQTARGFWLSAYDSRNFSLTRVNRKEIDCVPSCSIIGGIQPDVVHGLMEEASRNDGLVQRFNAVMMPDAMRAPNDDVEIKYPLTVYENLIKKMRSDCPLRLTGATLHFSPKAAEVRDKMFAWVREKVAETRLRNPQLSSHINKFSGMFLRFCGVYHMIENYTDKQPRQISAETANKVYRFMTSCRLKHAECFYSMLIENEENNDMRNIAEFILAHRLDRVSAREMQRGSARLRKISTRDIAHTAGNMVALGWLQHIAGKRADSHNWDVNPDVHELFRARANYVRGKNADMVLSIEEAKAAARAKAEAEEAQLEADDIPPHMLN